MKKIKFPEPELVKSEYFNLSDEDVKKIIEDFDFKSEKVAVESINLENESIQIAKDIGVFSCSCESIKDQEENKVRVR